LFNSRRVVVRVSGLAALAVVGLVASGTAASAVTASGPGISAAPIMAAAGSAPQTLSETYGCDLSTLGHGLGGVNIDATLSTPGSGVEGNMAPATLTTQATSVSPAVSKLLPALDSVEVTGTAPVNSTSGKGVDLAGKSGPVAANATELPSITAAGTLLLTAVGTTTVYIPPVLRVTLNAQGKVLAVLDCNTNEGSVKISVTAAPVPVPVPSGPVYKCGIYVTLPPSGKTQLVATQSGPIPFTVSATGRRTTGNTDTVSLSVAGGAASGMPGGPAPSGVKMAFAAGLPMTGAQPGMIRVTKQTTDLNSLPFSGSGHLYLAKPGTDRLLYPRWFTDTITGPTVYVKHKPFSITATLSCAIKTELNQVALTLNITGQPVPTATSTAAAGGTAANGAVPAGAPNTGGGPRPGSDLPMAVGGTALLIVGAGFVVVAARRRGQPVS
jgi:hypothetical protein